tara:strand:+ start:688 stop:1113 length:426 start_codon:yes stop_codon:yes gene_type:complete
MSKSGVLQSFFKVVNSDRAGDVPVRKESQKLLVPSSPFIFSSERELYCVIASTSSPSFTLQHNIFLFQQGSVKIHLIISQIQEDGILKFGRKILHIGFESPPQDELRNDFCELTNSGEPRGLHFIIGPWLSANGNMVIAIP